MNRTYNIQNPFAWTEFVRKINARLDMGFVPFDITVGPHKKKRSHPQLQLYWSIMKEITMELKKHGNEIDIEMTSDLMKSMFHYKIIILPDGERKKTLKSISDKSDMDIQEMSDVIDKIKVWCAELGVELNEQTRGRIR